MSSVLVKDGSLGVSWGQIAKSFVGKTMTIDHYASIKFNKSA